MTGVFLVNLWWGHRIPAWYKGDEVYVGETAPEDEGWVQDNDVLRYLVL